MRSYSKGLKYSILESNHCEVSGRGLCFKRSILIPAEHGKRAVKRVGESAFEMRKKLESVVIPEGVTSIGKNAFRGCESLKSITLPSTLEDIEEGAFAGCIELTEIAIPKKLGVIEEGVFADCSKLESINLSKISTVGKRAFYNCERLDGIDLASAILITDEAFADCKALRSVKIPRGECKVSVSAFEKCDKPKLGKLWIGNKYIGRLREAVFEENGIFAETVNELFLELGKNKEPNEIREMFRIYRKVMYDIAIVGLDQAMHITYLSDEDREALAKVLFDDGYGKALHKLMAYASWLYSELADAVGTSGTKNERLPKEYAAYLGNKAEETKLRADAFADLLKIYDPKEGDLGKTVKTSSIDFGGFIEHMDQVFNFVYMHIDIDANADTVLTEY